MIWLKKSGAARKVEDVEEEFSKDDDVDGKDDRRAGRKSGAHPSGEKAEIRK